MIATLHRRRLEAKATKILALAAMILPWCVPENSPARQVLTDPGGGGGGGLPRGLKHGVVWYSSSNDPAVLAIAAQRYSLGITGKGAKSEVDRAIIKSMNPGFLWLVYDSATDNYVADHPFALAEHESLVSLAARKGWDVEEAYTHYRDDTQVSLGGDTLLVPGWGAGSAHSGVEARVPVFYRDRSRRLTNFSTRRARQLHKEVMIDLALDAPFAGTSVYADGIALDNAAGRVSAYGTLLSGGHILEAPGHPAISSQQFQNWFWAENLGPFLTQLKDSLESSANWSRNGRRKYLSINVGSAWDDSYVSRDVADILFLEFQYNPVRNAGADVVTEAYRRDSLATSAGIASFYSAAPIQSLPSVPGSFSYGEALLGNLAWFLVTRTHSTLFFEQGSNGPAVAGWDSLTWRGCIDVADDQLGEAIGGPYTIAEGVDPVGNAYVVEARRYENGMALVRNRGRWTEGIEPETIVDVPLPEFFAPVAPSGVLGAVGRHVTLRNGQGALLLGGHTVVGAPPPEGEHAVLEPNVPNPFGGETVIHFGLDRPSRVLLRVFDVRGRQVARILDRSLPAGSHAATWDGRTSRGSRSSPGVYWYRLDTSDASLTRKLILTP